MLSTTAAGIAYASLASVVTSAMTLFPECFSEAIDATKSGFARDGRTAGKGRRQTPLVSQVTT
ncbi:hypothetical protein [Burkholderia sp. LMG 13014]|uniref:hypothetical protein n=1 Tax=Burkholderia sp. LMG 13014 TaxID=2709306 RepID=UPI00196450EA|nr:hypothetical protein [Burkholderia sp. LMG 13014]